MVDSGPVRGRGCHRVGRALPLEVLPGRVRTWTGTGGWAGRQEGPLRNRLQVPTTGEGDPRRPVESRPRVQLVCGLDTGQGGVGKSRARRERTVDQEGVGESR